MKYPFHSRASRDVRPRRQSATWRDVVSPGARLVRVEHVGRVEGGSSEPVAIRLLVWNFSTFQPFNTSTSYYTHDGNKNVSDVVALDGLLAAHYEYAPFGEVVDNADSSTWICTTGQMNCNPFCFSSEYNDTILDLVYYNYRHYEPVIGRWLNFDPIGLDNNPYCFAYNSPGIDVLGLLKFDSSCDSKLTRMIESSVYSITNNLLKVRIRNGVASAKIANILKSQKAKVPFDWHVIGVVNDTIDEDKVYNMIDRVYYEILRGKTEIICCSDTRKSSPCKNPLNATASAAHEKGKIYLCKGALRSPETYGGYACIIVHELIHKFGMTIRQTDDDGTRLQKERATVLIFRVVDW